MRFALLLTILFAITLVEWTKAKIYLVETKDDSGVKRMKKHYTTRDGQKAGGDYDSADWFRITK